MTDDTCWIQTFTGRKFHPLDPDPDEVFIEDIAHSLSRQARFTGHTKGEPYSIAEHSVRVAWLILDQGRPAEVIGHKARWHEPMDLAAARSAARKGLFHDGSEAYLVDLPSPIKHDPRFAFFEDVEERVLDAVFEHLSLDPGLPPVVKWADAVLFRQEAVDLMAPLHPEFRLPDLPPLATITPWSWKSARRTFMDVYRELFTAPTEPGT